MTYSHHPERTIVPVSQSPYDIEPILEALDPSGDIAVHHLMTDHPDLFDAFEEIASGLSAGDSKTKISLLRAMARALAYIEQREND